MVKAFFLVTALLIQSSYACNLNGTEGILPENDLDIPYTALSINGISEGKFNAVISKIEAVYAPIIAEKGGRLEMVSDWREGTVNAYATRSGDVWKVILKGGLARHKDMWIDGFSLVVCHEIGHHLGGFPHALFQSWAANEGQSDYFGAMKCLRRVWQSENNAAAVRGMIIPKILSNACYKAWTTKEDRDLCIRIGLAGSSLSRFFASTQNQSSKPTFTWPDRNQVEYTDDYHPGSQCRLDTYFQGALCEKQFSDDFGQDDEITGACHGTAGHTIGLRPRCWFRPEIE